jgi:tetratricopeptide (TPR) repeat protein
MSFSENHYLTILSSEQRESLTRLEIYMACITLANNGQAHNAENQLAPQERQLLEIRRQIVKGKSLTAYEDLNQMLSKPISPFHQAEILFLSGLTLHHLGDHALAALKIREASEFYAQAGDPYRRLRALINSYISQADLNSYVYGELVAFEQQARRNEFYDLVALILRGRAYELMMQNQHHQAIPQLLEAIHYYELDGAPADRALAQAMLVITYYLVGNYESAENLNKCILVRTGKVESYIKIINDLAHGRTPKIEKAHPFANAQWKILTLKKSSIPGKIIMRLMQGPAQRDELISFVWGAQALDPSYCSRLHTAISSLKKNKKMDIIFDGDFYKLAE